MTGIQHELHEVQVTLSYFEHWLSAGRFAYVDELLQTFPVDGEIACAAFLTVLTITFNAKDKLKHREAFLARVEVLLREALGSERAEKLLEYRR